MPYIQISNMKTFFGKVKLGIQDWIILYGVGGGAVRSQDIRYNFDRRGRQLASTAGAKLIRFG